MREAFDIVVVGGGIHGVGVAQAAAAAGHCCLLLEQTALAAGTSSRSSKLIHGGLRYLETAQIGLVRECLRERAILLRIAPDLVHLSRMYFPVYRSSRRPPWQVLAGLTAYAVLGGLSATSRFRRVPHSEWDGLDGLRTRELRAVFQYFDAQTDDRLLTEAVMRSALELGVELAVPATFESATLRQDGALVRFSTHGTTRECFARVIVNAAGPWANLVLDRIEPAQRALPIDLVAGAHIVLPVPSKGGVFYVESPADGRVVFIMPWHGVTLVGTTETPYAGDPAMVTALESERLYLLEVFRHYFPDDGAGLDVGAITQSFSGLRVLPAGDQRAFRRSRETILHADREKERGGGNEGAPRVITIYGGKLTAYRATASRVLRRIRASLPQATQHADTGELPLTPQEARRDQ